MKSAATIRTCSLIMMGITIIGAIAGGIVLIAMDDDMIPIALIVWVAGGFWAVMQNALFQGFADIVDNTYATACKANGKNAKSTKEAPSVPMSFQQPFHVSNDKKAYASDLLSKGLISEADYYEMIGGNE